MKSFNWAIYWCLIIGELILAVLLVYQRGQNYPDRAANCQLLFCALLSPRLRWLFQHGGMAVASAHYLARSLRLEWAE